MSFSFFTTPHQHQFFQPQQLHLQQQQQMLLFTKDGTLASYNTNWKDLHPHSQNFLLQIEERVIEYRYESQRLDQSSRLYECSVSNDGFKSDSGYVVQILLGISAAMPKNLQELASSVKNISRNTNMAVSSFKILSPRFHPSEENALSTTAPSQTVGVTTTPASVPMPDFYCGLPKKPSSFLCQTISRFEKYLCECCQWIEELEPLLKISERNTYNNGSFSLQYLPEVMANMHDVFIHVAAKVESSIHQHMNYMKSTYQVKHRRWQENDPSRVADRCNTARKLLAGLLSSSGTVWASTAPQTSSLTSNSSGSGLPAFNMPSSVPSSSFPYLFVTPPTSAPVSPLLGSSSATPQLLNSGTVWASTAPQTSSLTSISSGSGLSVFSIPSSVPSSSFPYFFVTPPTSTPVSALPGPSSATPQTSLLNSSSSSLFGFTPSQFGNSAPLCSTTSGRSTSSTSFSLGIAPGSRTGFKSRLKRPTSKTKTHPC